MNCRTENKPTEETVEVFDDYYDDLTIQEGLKNGTMYQVRRTLIFWSHYV